MASVPGECLPRRGLQEADRHGIALGGGEQHPLDCSAELIQLVRQEEVVPGDGGHPVGSIDTGSRQPHLQVHIISAQLTLEAGSLQDFRPKFTRTSCRP